MSDYDFTFDASIEEFRTVINTLHNMGVVTDDEYINIIYRYQQHLTYVVFCDECVFMDPSGQCMAFASRDVFPSASDYCSHGERKSENGTKI